MNSSERTYGVSMWAGNEKDVHPALLNPLFPHKNHRRSKVCQFSLL